jgi:DNA polymerase-3 subunit gamma/tau
VASDRIAAPKPPAAPSDGAAPAFVSIDDVRRQWARVLEDIKRTKMICHALLIDGTPLDVSGDMLTVGLRSAYSFHADNLNRPENRDIVEGALARVLSRPLRFQCRLYDTPPAPAGEVTAEVMASGGISLVDRARELFGAEIVEEEPAG